MSDLLPTWTGYYPNGTIKLGGPNNKFKKKDKVLTSNYAINTTREILETGNNENLKLPKISNKKNKLKKTIPLSYEKFNDYSIINQRGHIHPIWILIAILVLLWIIFILFL